MAVKSFQGARAKKTGTKTPQLLVRDIMCQNLILFHPEQSIHEVMQKFVKYRISGGPVVNNAGKLVGVISEADCMKEISDLHYLSPSGCTFWGKEIWSKKKIIIWVRIL